MRAILTSILLALASPLASADIIPDEAPPTEDEFVARALAVALLSLGALIVVATTRRRPRSESATPRA